MATAKPTTYLALVEQKPDGSTMQATLAADSVAAKEELNNKIKEQKVSLEASKEAFEHKVEEEVLQCKRYKRASWPNVDFLIVICEGFTEPQQMTVGLGDSCWKLRYATSFKIGTAEYTLRYEQEPSLSKAL